VVLCVTCARTPIVRAAWLQGRDVLVVAVGADSAGKQELEPACLAAASLRLADSRAQCIERGEMQHAVTQGLIRPDEIVEIGEWLGRVPPPPPPRGLVIFDTTGVAVQDVAIAELTLKALREPRGRL